MGHEIVYCFRCSSRIVGADSEKTSAVQIGNRICCGQCLPAVLAELPPAQRQQILERLSKPAAKPTRKTPREGTEIPSNRTPRGGTPGVAASNSSPTVVIVAVVGAVLVLLLLVVFSSSESRPTEREAVVPKHVPPPVHVPDRPPPSDREKTAMLAITKARDGVRSGADIDAVVRLWDDAVRAADHTPQLEEATKERNLALARRKDVYAQELSRLLDSIDGMARQEEFGKAIDLLASARKRHDLPEWTQPIDKKLDDLKKQTAAAVPFREPADAEGLVCIEAEHYFHKVDRESHSWTPAAGPPGAMGEGAMVCLPNSGVQLLKDWAALAPRLDYRIQFTKPGKHYVWIRGSAEAPSDNSVHLGLDGAQIPTMSHLGFAANRTWAWSNKMMDNKEASFTIDAPGIRLLNLWIREDGALIDRIVITTNPRWSPKDSGPPETSR